MTTPNQDCLFTIRVDAHSDPRTTLPQTVWGSDLVLETSLTRIPRIAECVEFHGADPIRVVRVTTLFPSQKVVLKLFRFYGEERPARAFIERLRENGFHSPIEEKD